MGLYLSKLQYEVKFYANEKYTDRLACSDDISRYPFLKGMESKDNQDSDIILFYNFPKSIYANYDLASLKGSLKIGYLGWEESLYPLKLVNECNKELHVIAALSKHVREVMRRSGIKIPMKVINHGLDLIHAPQEEYRLRTKKSFKIYHNSSGQYRKGLDLLLKAYFNAFTKEDDVALIIKLYPNQSLDKEALKQISPDRAEVEIINSASLTDPEMKYLAGVSQMHVYPTRGEGFGLPIAEGLALGKAVITTGYGGQMDFTNDDNSFLIGYKISDSLSHLNIPGSKIAEPDLDELTKTMCYVFENYNSPEVIKKMEKAKEVKVLLTWEKAAKEMSDLIEASIDIPKLKDKKMAVVSTYNSNCGIAVYSQDLYEKIINSFKNINIYANKDISSQLQVDPKYIKRIWELKEPSFDKLKQELLKDKPEYIHIQYNSSFFSPLRLLDLINFSRNNDIRSVVTLHSIIDSLKDIKHELNSLDVLLVHSKDDIKALKELGINNAISIDHGIPNYPDTNIFKLQKTLGLEGRRVISTHGLIHDKKGFIELTEALVRIKNEFPNILLLMLTAINTDNSTSKNTYDRILKIVKDNDLEKNVVLIPEFLESEVIIKLLQASELIILPYSQVIEGASGALRYALSSHRPILLSNSYIFGDIDIGPRLKDNTKDTISYEVIKLLQDDEILKVMKGKVEAYIKEFDWEDIVLKYLNRLSKM